MEMAASPPDRSPDSSWADDSWSVLPWNRHWAVLLPAVGKRLRWRWGRGPLSFRLESLSIIPGWAGMLRSVRATAVEVDLATGTSKVRLDEVCIAARKVRLRTSSLHLEHVEVQVGMGQTGLDAMLDSGLRWPAAARLLPRLRIGADVLLPGSRITAAAVVDDRLQLTAEMANVVLPLRTGRGEVVVDLNESRTDDTVTVDLPGVAEPGTLRGGVRRDET